MGASGAKDVKLGESAVDGIVGDNGELEAVKTSGGTDTAESTTKNSETLFNAATQSTSENLPESLLKFHPFNRLPPEVRLKIWRLVANYQRIIAFEFVESPNDDEVVNPFHSTLKLNSRSKFPPLLRVNRESYGECRKLYQKRKGYYVPTYLYNPCTDVLYFGGPSYCSCALSKAFWRVEDDTPRVAIDISIPLAKCCGGESIVAQTMSALHGYKNGPDDREPNKRSFHCQGLKEILLVTESRPLAMIPSRIRPAITFRPASTIGITKAQAALRKEFEFEIAKIQDENPSLFGPNAWVGDDKPTFSFVNLARDKAGEVFETLAASRSEVNELKVHHSSFINDLRRSTGCKIILPHQKYDDEFPMEIGIKGTKGGVEVCRRKIQDMISLQT